jgi:hypothetical protein
MAAIRAYVNSYHVFIAWKMDAPIPGCRGFALKRKLSASGSVTTAATGDAAPTWAGLEDDDAWQDKHFTAGAAQREIAFWVP